MRCRDLDRAMEGPIVVYSKGDKGLATYSTRKCAKMRRRTRTWVRTQRTTNLKLDSATTDPIALCRLPQPIPAALAQAVALPRCVPYQHTCIVYVSGAIR